MFKKALGEGFLLPPQADAGLFVRIGAVPRWRIRHSLILQHLPHLIPDLIIEAYGSRQGALGCRGGREGGCFRFTGHYCLGPGALGMRRLGVIPAARRERRLHFRNRCPRWCTAFMDFRGRSAGEGWNPAVLGSFGDISLELVKIQGHVLGVVLEPDEDAHPPVLKVQGVCRVAQLPVSAALYRSYLTRLDAVALNETPGGVGPISR
jgi:hypothetical protein